MEIRQLDAHDVEAVDRFLDRIPEGDRTFFREDVDDPATRAAWFRPGTARLVAVDSGEVVGYAGVMPMTGWSSHVGALSLIVDPERRGQGLGGALARRALLAALDLGLTKLVVEVMARQQGTIELFRSLGFVPEALLTDYVRDHSGELHDLMLLAHSVEASWGSLRSTGVAESV
jgi:L-amino acid N-acyltransferase YncA